MSGYLLDTNILSEPLRPEPNPAVVERLRLHQKDIATAAPVWHELVYGCTRLPRSKKRRIIETYLEEIVRETVPVLPYDMAAASWHARERARLSRKGKTPSFVDGQIAAIAGVNDFVLVTSNVKHYDVFKGLKIENWMESG